MIHSNIEKHIPQILQACIDASDAILQLYHSEIFEVSKSDGSPVTKADLLSNEIINNALAQTGIPIITEENQLEPFETRQTWEYVWLVDPLDGTREFIKKNDEFVICIALVYKQEPILGIITSPVNKEILIGGNWIKPAVVTFNNIHLRENWKFITPKTHIQDAVVVSGSRSHDAPVEINFNKQIRSLFSQVQFNRKGSALKFFDLALGHADVYPRFAPTMEWDIAAGQAILEALGGEVVQVETEQPLHYNKENLMNPYFVARTKAILEHMKK